MQRDRAVGEDALGAFRVELEGVTGGEDLGRECLTGRLARLGHNPRDELRLALDEHVHRPTQVAGALAKRELGPGRLRLARAFDRREHLGLPVELDLAEALERGRVREP